MPLGLNGDKGFKEKMLRPFNPWQNEEKCARHLEETPGGPSFPPADPLYIPPLQSEQQLAVTWPTLNSLTSFLTYTFPLSKNDTPSPISTCTYPNAGQPSGFNSLTSFSTKPLLTPAATGFLICLLFELFYQSLLVWQLLVLLSDDNVHFAMFCCNLKEESCDIFGPKERSWSRTQLLSSYLILEKLSVSVSSGKLWRDGFDRCEYQIREWSSTCFMNCTIVSLSLFFLPFPPSLLSSLRCSLFHFPCTQTCVIFQTERWVSHG